MIVVKLQGGLGNQMFQYALGKALFAKLLTPLYFDTSFFRIEENGFSTKRNYELNSFSFTIHIADSKTVDSFIQPKPVQLLFNKLKLYKKLLHQESSFEFDENVLNLSAPVYLDGYWQSEKYFKNVAGQIRKDFVFKNPFNKVSELVADNLSKEVNSVSVHIRRGDYITSSANSQVHGACSAGYYRQAIQQINNKIDQPKYYFFSDEPEWVEQNLIDNLSNFKIIKHNQNADSWQDMALMSRCKHHIIANSSFSWWGAWLNPSPVKIVIAPSNWFAHPDLNRQSLTIIPGNWTRI